MLEGNYGAGSDGEDVLAILVVQMKDVVQR